MLERIVQNLLLMCFFILGKLSRLLIAVTQAVICLFQLWVRWYFWQILLKWVNISKDSRAVKNVTIWREGGDSVDKEPVEQAGPEFASPVPIKRGAWSHTSVTLTVGMGSRWTPRAHTHMSLLVNVSSLS